MIGVMHKKMKWTLITRIVFGKVGNGKLGRKGVGLQFLKR
jgi:hypothetical protein